jgi:hypothetical protein
MALIEKSAETGKESIGIYDTNNTQSWECLHHFTPHDTFDLEDVKFSGDGSHLYIWESPLKCKLLVYKLNFSNDGRTLVECQ